MNLHEAIQQKFLLSEEAKLMRYVKRVNKKGNPSFVEAKSFWVISDEVKALQIIEKIVLPLEKIIYLYIPTNYYNYIPHTNKDAWDYLDNKLNKVYTALHSMLFLNNEEFTKTLQIIDTVNTFVKSYSGVDGVKDPKWFEVNPNLNYFHTCYSVNYNPSMKDWTEDDFELAQTLPFDYSPKNKEEVECRERYIEYLHCYSYARNFKRDKYETDDNDKSESIFLMHELAYTLRLVFMDALPHLCNK